MCGIGSARLRPARVVLQPGAGFGLSDIQLALIEPPQNLLQLFVDNQGVKSTGEYQIGGYYRRYGLFGMDDRLVVYLTNARKTINANISYNAPIGIHGTRAGVSFAHGDTVIIDGPYKTLDVESQSDTVSVNLTHPLFIDPTWLVQGSVAVSGGHSQSTHAEIKVTDDDTLEITAGLSMDYAAPWIVFSIAPSVSFVTSRSNILDEGRDFVLFRGTALARVPLAHELLLTANASWQMTAEDLLPSGNLFQIGGPTTVRSYGSNAYAGDQGIYANLELHRSLSELARGLDVFAFADAGAVFSTYPKQRSISSLGAGLNWSLDYGVSLELTGAVPLQSERADDDFVVFGRVTFRPNI